MWETGAAGSVRFCGRADDPELVLTRWIMAAIVMESFAEDLVPQLPPSRMIRALLLMQEMDVLVQNLQAVLQRSCEKSALNATQGIASALVPH